MPAPHTPLRVAVIEHSRLVREALVRIVAGEPGLVCEASTSDLRAIDRIVGPEVDVVVIGTQGPGIDPSDLLAGVRATAPEALLVVLVQDGDEHAAAEAAVAGADALISVSDSIDDLLLLLCSGRARRAADDAIWSVPTEDESAATRARQLGITPRQHEVLRHLAEGLSPDHVARALSIRLSTCRDHIKALHRALDCSSTTEVVVVGVRSGLLPDLAHQR